MFVLRQAVAFVDQQLSRFRENIFIANDRAQFFEEAFVHFKL